MNFSTFSLAEALGPTAFPGYGNQLNNSTIASTACQQPATHTEGVWPELSFSTDDCGHRPGGLPMYTANPADFFDTMHDNYHLHAFFPNAPSPDSTETTPSAVFTDYTPSPASTGSLVHDAPSPPPAASPARSPLSPSPIAPGVPSPSSATMDTSIVPTMSSSVGSVFPGISSSPPDESPNHPDQRHERTDLKDAFDRFYGSVWIRRIVHFYLDPACWKSFVAGNPQLGQCSTKQCSSNEAACVLSDDFGCTTCVRLGVVCSHLETCFVVTLSKKMNVDPDVARRFLRVVNNHKEHLLASRDANCGGVSSLFHYVSILEDYVKSANADNKTRPPPYLLLKLRQAICLAAFDRAANTTLVNAQLAMIRDIATILKKAAVDRTISSERAVGQIISLYHERADSQVIR